MVQYHKLEYIDLGSDPHKAIDISRYVQSIEKFTDVGTGEIASAIVTLRIPAGEFVSKTVADKIPEINKLDTLRLELNNGRTGSAKASYRRYMIADRVIPQINRFGRHLTLELLGREHFLQDVHYTGLHEFSSCESVLEAIAAAYIQNRGRLQPSVTLEAVGIPDHAYGTFEFSSISSCYDAMMDVVSRLSLPAAQGGGGQFYTLRFEDDFTNLNTSTVLKLKCIVSPEGYTPSVPPVMPRSLTTTESREPREGNAVLVIGHPTAGTLPSEFATFRDAIEEFRSLPPWRSGQAYAKYAWVQSRGFQWQALRDVAASSTRPVDGNNWRRSSLFHYLANWLYPDRYEGTPAQQRAAVADVDKFSYSPWTKGKLDEWKGNCANPTSRTLATALRVRSTDLAIPDMNTQIADPGIRGWSDEVHCRARSLADIPAALLYDTGGGQAVRYYRGLRVLVDPSRGALGRPFTGNDPNGVPYRNAIVQVSPSGEWVVSRAPNLFDRVTVLNEAATYEYGQPPSTTAGRRRNRTKPSESTTTRGAAWRDISAALMANHNFHYPFRFEAADGLVASRGDLSMSTGTSTHDFQDNSAVRISFVHREDSIFQSMIEKAAETVRSLYDGLTNLLGLTSSDETYTDDEEDEMYDRRFYNEGWYAVLFRAPFPMAKRTSSKQVGSVYGGTAALKNPVLSQLNAGPTPSGYSGFGHADSEDLGPIHSFRFFLKFDIRGAIVADWLGSGDLPFRLTIDDENRQLGSMDVKVRFQEETQLIEAVLSEFQPFIGRMPRGFSWPEIAGRIINSERYLPRAINLNRIQCIKAQCMLPFDDEGRYDPWNWERALRFLGSVVLPADNATLDVEYDGIIDAPHFTKEARAIAKSDQATDYEIEAPPRRFPNITNTLQLKKIARSELSKTSHDQSYWSGRYEKTFSVRHGDQAYVDDKYIVGGAADAAGRHKRKLVVKKVTYSLSQASAAGGPIAAIDFYRPVRFGSV